MSKTNQHNLEARFDDGEDILDYFEIDAVLTTNRLIELSRILNLSALAREANINVQTLQAKIRRKTPLSGEETRRIADALKRHHLATVSKIKPLRNIWSMSGEAPVTFFLLK